MSLVTSQFTMSLDGFVAAPGDDVGPIFGWFSAGDTEFPLTGMSRTVRIARSSADLLNEQWSKVGAIVTGRRDFDVSRAWGGQLLLGVPHFIVTHSVPTEWDRPDSPFVFVLDGVESAIKQARQAARGKNVSVGGTQIVRQCLRAGLLDQIQIDLVPIILGDGIRLFDNAGPAPVGPGSIQLEVQQVVPGEGVTHLIYRVVKN